MMIFMHMWQDDRCDLQSLLHLLASNHKMFVLLHIGQSLLEHIILCFGSGSIEVQFDVEPQLMDGW
jgi:hypothetical protein